MVPIYILAGGKSLRFGSDKARAELHGEPLIRRIILKLESCAENFTAVADVADKYLDLGIRTIPDELPGLGPMGGLLAALKDRNEPGWILLTSCDMVALDRDWVTMLAAACSPSARAVAFKGDRVEPLFALYHTDLIGQVDRSVATGELSPARLLLAAQTNAAFLPLPVNWPALAHVNTRAEFDGFDA